MIDAAQEIKPKSKQNLIDLVRVAGFDVSDWANYKGGPTKAGANPKYCYEWCFTEGNKRVANIWFENMHKEGDALIQCLNMRELAALEVGPRKARAHKFDRFLSDVFVSAQSIRAIILDRKIKGTGSVERRLLDPTPWHVSDYDSVTGACTLTRGEKPEKSNEVYDPAIQEFYEGEVGKRMIQHRRRERLARAKKIEKTLQENDGKLICEVPGCGFEFAKVYGELGQGYAHVHHKIPLSKLPIDGGKVRLSDLAVVCANCHAMIHIGGKCRDLDQLIHLTAAWCSPAS